MEEDIKILTEEEIKNGLKNLPGREREGNKIKKEFKFESFLQALDFLNNLAPFFNENDHHPNIHWSYKKILFELTRYSVGEKLTERDFRVASEIENRFKEK